MGLALILFFLFLPFETVCFAEPPSASQIERAREDLKKEEALRARLEEKRVFIEKIVVEGVALLNTKEIKKIVAPFQKHWLYEHDIEKIIHLLKVAYKKKGYPNQPAQVVSEVTDNCLKIKVKEEN